MRIASLLALLDAFATPVNTSETTHDRIQHIEEAPSGLSKLELLQDLADDVDRHKIDVDNDGINSIATLLSSQEDYVRLWSAATLGYLGPRSKPYINTVDRLYKSSRLEECKTGDISRSGSGPDSDVYLVALKRIDRKHSFEIACPKR